MVTIDADAIGHAVLESDGPAFAAVAARWPSTVVDGKIDRGALSAIVFADGDQLTALESLTHPHIFGRIRARVEEVSDVIVVEIPLLDKAPDGAWQRLVVDCDDDVRLARLLDRGMTEAEARSRMEMQPSRAQWLAMADMVVPNHGSLDNLRDTVTKLIPHL